MYFVWILVAMPILALLYTAFVVARGEKPKVPDHVAPLEKPVLNSTTRLGSFRPGKREIRWISSKEFESLTHRTDDVIFIDLRSEGKLDSVPFPHAHVLSIAPGQLVDVLRWLPPSSSVVLYGASNLCASMVWSVRDLAGSAPIYVLSEVPVHSEAA